MEFIMKQHKAILIENLLEKSKIALEDAKLALDNERLDNAHNRIYYALFYIVSALGYKFDFITSKHSQLLGWFNKEIIHNKKLFDQELFKIYKKAYENRMKSDYEFTYKASKENVLDLFNKAGSFIETVRNFIITP